MPKVYDRVKSRIKPDWLKIRIETSEEFAEMANIVKKHNLHTICSSGMCPNKSECWNRRTATFMILGDICSRSCRFCATKSGKPTPIDPNEPANVAKSIALMGLKHAVITSVTRDDLPDGGAQHWAELVGAIRKQNPESTIELLIPDLDAKPELIDIVIESQPDIIGHNIETVERLTPLVRSRAKYRTSLETIAHIAQSGVVAKSGLMVGLGESEEEVVEAMKDLVAAGCKILTIGQYLQPTRDHWEVAEYVTPEQFERYREVGLELGFDYVASAPLVRSSYLADEALKHTKI